MILRRTKRILLFLLRALGAFRVSRYLTRHQLRILCYHGFSIGDEYAYLPGMFMRGETFARRMATLDRLRFPVLSLDDAVAKLQAGEIGNAEVVITLDDGWTTNQSIAYPILSSHGYPATIYVTTEHLQAGEEAFNMIMYYLFLTSTLDSVTVSGVHDEIDGTYPVQDGALESTNRIIDAAMRYLSLAERQSQLGNIAKSFGRDIAEILGEDRFRLLSAEQIAELSKKGVDIELHTHTHNLSGDGFEEVQAEIVQNRHAVESITGKFPKHFCYPSGRWSDSHPEWLSQMGIESATTCDPGLNDASTNPLLLRRYLDQEDISEIEFEAAVSGFRYILQRAFVRG